MEFQEFIQAELLILIPVIYVIGIMLKKSALKDKYIPTLLGIISVILSTLYVVSVSNLASFKDVLTAIFTAITQGVLIAGASVYCNQIIKQAGNSE